MKYTIERNDQRLDLEHNCLLPSGHGTYIEANSDEEAKQKAKEWALEKGEILGDWIKGKNDKMFASIASNRRKYHKSIVILYIKPDHFYSSIYKWIPGIIIKDFNGNSLDSQLIYGEIIKGKMIKRYVDIENGVPSKLPSDIEILGENGPHGFRLTGLKFVDKLEHSEFEGW